MLFVGQKLSLFLCLGGSEKTRRSSFRMLYWIFLLGHEVIDPETHIFLGCMKMIRTSLLLENLKGDHFS